MHLWGMAKSKNQEVTVKCPAVYPDGRECGKEVLRRGLHLHVMRKNDKAHGEQGDVPPDLDLDSAEVVGERSVDINYPDNREQEDVARQCPYCKKTYRGKQGLEIHFGQVVGRKNHPAERSAFPAADECPIVRVDENDNVLDVVEEGASVVMPSTERRRAGNLRDKLVEYAAGLRDEGEDERAEVIEQALRDVSEE